MHKFPNVNVQVLLLPKYKLYDCKCPHFTTLNVSDVNRPSLSIANVQIFQVVNETQLRPILLNLESSFIFTALFCLNSCEISNFARRHNLLGYETTKPTCMMAAPLAMVTMLQLLQMSGEKER